MKKVFLFLLCLYYGNVQAAPSAYLNVDNSLSNLKNPTDSVILGDTDDPKTIYVLPPSSGEAKLAKKITYSGPMVCEKLKDLSNLEQEATLRYNRFSDLATQHRASLASREQELLESRKRAEEYRASNEALGQYDDLKERILQLDALISETSEQMMQVNCSDEPEKCKEFRDTLSQLKKEKAEANAQLRKIADDNREIVKTYNKLNAAYEATKKVYDDIKKAYDDAVRSARETRDYIVSVYAEWALKEGAWSSIEFNTGWEENIQSIQNANPGYFVRQIPTSNVQVYASVGGGQTEGAYRQTLPMFLDYDVNGVRYNPYGISGQQGFPAFPAVMVANTRLSMSGACMVLHPDMFGVPVDQQGSPVFGMSATYAYPSVFRYDINAEYNMHSVYKLIRKHSKKRGFFKTKTFASVVEDQSGWSDFSIKFLNEDDERNLTDAEKTQIAAEIKAELVREVLNMIATPTDKEPEPGAPPESGASEIGDGLYNLCGRVNAKCAVVAFVFKGLDALFGSSSAESYFERNLNFRASKHLSTREARNRQGSVVFVPRD